MSFYTRLGIDLIAGAGQDTKVKVSVTDSTSQYLGDKITVLDGKVTITVNTNAGVETMDFSVNEALINHDLLLNYDIAEHRIINDSTTSTTALWSSDKIQDELDIKVNKIDPIADNRIIKSVGSTGVDFEQTGITIDDSDNITGVNDLTVTGDLTVNGTTTTVNTDTLDVEDANITINKNGTQSSADLNTAGLTVEMSDATDARFGYDSTLTSKFKLGEVGDLREIATLSHSQIIINKTINADNNTVTNLEVDNLKAGVLVTDLNGSIDDSKLASALSIKTYVDQEIDGKDEASEIIFDNTGTNLVGTDVQAVIEELDARFPDGDIYVTSFALANNQVAAANITGLLFDSSVRSFESQISVFIDADTNLYEEFSIKALNIDTDWVMSVTSLGDDSNIILDIDSSGQVTYTSSSYTGFVSGTMKFRAMTT